MTDDRVAFILVDYPRRARMKILGHAKILEGVEAKEWLPKLSDLEYNATVERVFVVKVDAYDWNCQQHITPRYTEEQIHAALAPVEKRMQELELENERLRDKIARLNPSTA